MDRTGLQTVTTAFDITSTPARGSRSWVGPLFPLSWEEPQLRALPRVGEGPVNSRSRSFPGDVKGPAKAGLPGGKGEREVCPQGWGWQHSGRVGAGSVAAVRCPGLRAGAGSRGWGGEGTRWAGSGGGGGPGAAGSSPRVCLSAARRAEAVRWRAGQGCRPAPSPRPCPGPSAPAAARAPRPVPRPVPRPAAPQPRARRRFFNGQPARRCQLPRAHHSGGL